MPKPKTPKDSRPSRRPMTAAEMREMIGEMWALLAEERRINAERVKERAEQAKEHAKWAKKRAKYDDEQAKEHAKWAKERAKYEVQAGKEMAELRRTVDGIGKRTGDFMENTGRILERGVLARMKRAGGVGQVKGKVLGPLKKEGEYDGAVVNGKQTVVVEVKRNLRMTDVRDFLRRRLPRFVRDFPDLAAGRKVYGAMAFELDDDKGQAAELARESGLMLVQVSDRKGMKVLNPDPAKLRPIAG